jgi:tRNA-2-methylthio-N6-dimethylallyladenosine synthase
MVIGTRQFHRLEEFLHTCGPGGQRICALGLEDDPSAARAAPSPIVQQDTSNLKAFVPIILGCDNYCTYCIVPFVRGRQKSRPIEELRSEVSELVARGCKEVTLLGQNVLAYGRDLSDGRDFVSLLEDLNSIDGLERIRFTTAHPRDVHDRLIEAVANLPKVCEHLHLPIQAGQDRLLQAMNRGYTTAYYLNMAQKIRARIPDAAITTDIMVGFPGETEEEFAASMAFYEKLAFDQAFMFIYSPRPGTPAAKMAEQIPYKVKQARLVQLVELVNTTSIRINRTWIGRTEEVLGDEVSEKDAAKISGRLRNNKMVVFPGPADRIGQFVQVEITGAHLWGLTGEEIWEGS